MANKPRAPSSRGGRGGSKKTVKSGRQGIRNITRWSANKDIALLCALTKECRRDKFQPSWDRVAKWIGPNITGAAVEQHIAKLYSKLVQHRASSEPKPKKKKGSRSEGEDAHADYLKTEEDWGKGNEALANIFYDKPDISSMHQMQNEIDSDCEMIDDMEQTSRKRFVTGHRKQVAEQDDEDEQDDQYYLPGDPNELLLAGTKYLTTEVEAEDNHAAEFDEFVGNDLDNANYGPNTSGAANFPHNGGIDNQYNFAEGVTTASPWSFYPEQLAFSKQQAFVPGMDIRSQQSPLLQNQLASDNTTSPTMQGSGSFQGRLKANPLAMKMEPDNDEHIYLEQRFDGPPPSIHGVKKPILDRQPMMNPLYNWQGQPRMGNLNSGLYGMGQGRNPSFPLNAGMNVGVRSGNMGANSGYGTLMNSPRSDSNKAYVTVGHNGIGVDHGNNFQDTSLSGPPAYFGTSPRQKHPVYRPKPGHSTKSNEEHPYSKNFGTSFQPEREVIKSEEPSNHDEDPGFFNQYFNADMETFEG